MPNAHQIKRHRVSSFSVPGPFFNCLFEFWKAACRLSKLENGMRTIYWVPCSNRPIHAHTCHRFRSVTSNELYAVNTEHWTLYILLSAHTSTNIELVTVDASLNNKQKEKNERKKCHFPYSSSIQAVRIPVHSLILFPVGYSAGFPIIFICWWPFQYNAAVTMMI